MPQVVGHRHRLEGADARPPAVAARHPQPREQDRGQIRGSWPTTSRQSPGAAGHQHPPMDEVCLPVMRWASTWARSRCRKARLEVASRSASSCPCHFLFVRFVHVGAPGLRERDMRSLPVHCRRRRRAATAVAPNRRNRSGKGPQPRSNGGLRRRPADSVRGSTGQTARGDGPTTRSIGETAPARVPTVRRMALSARPPQRRKCSHRRHPVVDATRRNPP